jgi:hypothetical protein
MNQPGSPPAGVRDIHRIGGGSVENLRLKPREAALAVPGISVRHAGGGGRSDAGRLPASDRASRGRPHGWFDIGGVDPGRRI